MNLNSAIKPIKYKNKLIFLIILFCTTIWAIMIYSIINNFNNDKVISTTVISERLSKISELSTIKYNYSNIISLTDSKKFKDFYIPFTEKSFLIKYSGYIKAGVDLKDLDIVINQKSVTITLKKSKVLDHVINNEDFFVYDEKSSMFNKLSIQDMINEISNQKNKTEADLIKTGFLGGADTNAKLLLQGILSDMGFENITIILK
ncbi:DUF4230 domain-containing protein [Clostridium estertheticum]|uniref:DUF4230 domain-containing protein n=1 Tax=Clostridium estertheticum TaxID=238834 RepID=UPI0013E9504C|nr:DUF4230 domain-containing protein [Clostridium estertheticum]MBZ9685130.1 DUF4230 domain-containing protein [Clostridium estertheticum]